MFKCYLGCMICFSVFSMIVLSILQLPFDAKDEVGLNFMKHYPQGITQEYFDLPIEDLIERDNEWRDALLYNDIIDTIVIGHHGLADKYVFMLDGGYIAMAKPVQRNPLWYSHGIFPTKQWNEDDPGVYRRMDRPYQGWGELCGVAVDRALRWYKKQTVVGRYIPSKVLYYHDYSWWGRFLYALPNHNIPVAMHAWVTGLSTKSPSNDIGMYLFQKTNSISKLELALEYSDIILFDFLLDDHDRFGNHNWISSSDKVILAWDSGLAWAYGPKNSNTEILCGKNEWNGYPDDHPFDSSRPDCTRICRFRRETINQLENLSNAKNDSLGKRVDIELEIINGLKYDFEYGVFLLNPSGRLFWWILETTRYSREDFLDGLDVRTRDILTHVNSCIEIYGEQNVLL